MPCYAPNLIIKSAFGNKYIGSKIMHPEYTPGQGYVDKSTGQVSEVIEVPCGQCIGCRLDHSRMWADRITLEAMQYPDGYNWWITLTYDDDHVPISDKGTQTLCKKDLQDWIKRLRRQLEYHQGHTGLRFYACGEYGTHTLRPHYHVCIFNAPLQMQGVEAQNSFGDLMYHCDMIYDTWDKGHNVVTDLTWQTAAYTARYCTKKYKGVDKDKYANAGLVPEYAVMSRRPGIAGAYCDNHAGDIYSNDSIILPAQRGKSHISTPPRYFDNRFATIDPVRLAEAKELRSQRAQMLKAARERYTDIPEELYLARAEETAKIIADNRLPRIDI